MLIFLINCLLFLQIVNCISQTIVGDSDSLYSNILKEERSLRVFVPKEYKPGADTRYEVIYLSDGEWNMETFSFIYNYAADQGFVPPAIFVAVRNTYIKGANQRDRDFLPIKTIDDNIAGGADNFIAFYKNELIPYIEKKYPCNGEKSIWGHSYGGTFVMYVFLSSPDLFNSYYCSDPALSWNHNYLINLAINIFDKTPELNDKILSINGIVNTSKRMGSFQMDSILKIKAPKGLKWNTSFYPNETHNSVRLKGIYDGIKFNYSGYSNHPIEFHPGGGIVLKNSPTTIFLDMEYENAHYTIDGTDPTESSPKVGRTITINGPANLVIESFCNKKEYNKVGKGDYTEGTFIPPITSLKNPKKGGLKYSYYEGKWDSLPDFKKLTPIKTGITDSSFSFSNIKSSASFAFKLEGYIKVEKEGNYSFAMVTSDGSKFYLNGKMIINNDGVHKIKVKSYVIPLQKGYYPIRIEYFKKEGEPVLEWYYNNPGSEYPEHLPYNMQYYTK